MFERPPHVPYAYMRHQVAELVAEGLTDKQIGGRLNLSAKTVRYHIYRLRDDWQLDKRRNIRVQITRYVLTHPDKPFLAQVLVDAVAA